jgi:ABC-type phosphate transport system substrate-binding protein
MSTMLHKLTGAVPAIAGAALAFSWAGSARAQTPPNCDDLPNPVYVAGSTAVQPFLAKVAASLVASNITVVYQGQGSCVGVGYLTSSSNTITGTGVYWDATGTAVSGGCTLSLAGDQVLVGVSDVYAASCGVDPLPDGVADFKGPIQSMTFVVPGTQTTGSTQKSISAEAAYAVLGYGGVTYPIAPWTDPAAIEVRSATSGTQQMIAKAIGLPAGKWLGVVNSGSGAVVTGLQGLATAGNAEKGLGILASDVADKNPTTLKVLAYQHTGQHCGYLPDSAAGKFDKQNVRDGHYTIWGPLHMLANVQGGVVTDANAKAVIDAMTAPSAELITTEAKSSVVPDCAMRVTREGEVGPLASYMPPKSCECLYVAQATGVAAPAGCTPCPNGVTECTDPKKPACNYGYCEVQ